MNPAIGIDLGTSYSSVGVFRNDRFEIIANEEGGLTTPSFVAFTNTGCLIGNSAKNQLALNPFNTIFDVQRLIGCRFADAQVQADIKHFPFKVIDRGGKPAIEVEHMGEIKVFLPVEIISMILRKMKEIAENYLGCSVSNTIITTPTYWNASQRQSTKDAGLIAGLNVLRIIDAATCAAIAYGIGRRDKIGIRNVLIFDLGGGTCNTTLVTIEEEIFEVRSVAGHTHLGGEDFDNRLVNNFISEFKSKYRRDISWNTLALCRLRSACERAKYALSSSTRTTIKVESLFEGIDFNTSITLARFEELCQDLFRSTTTVIDRALADAKFDKTKIHEVVLVGGSSRIPMIQKIVTDYFDGHKPTKSINPDQAACYGAAVQAAVLSGDTSSKSIFEYMLLDVQPFSLGIESIGGQMTRLVPRNTTIPNRKSMVFSTAYDSQLNLPTCVLPICVFEGERQRVKDNNLLGKIELSSSLRVSRIEITIEIDANSVLHVSVLENDTGKRSNVFIPKIDRLYKEEIERMAAQSEEYRQSEAEAEAARVSAKNAREFQASVETPVNLYRTDEQRLGRFFSMSDNARNTYTDLELQNISDLLHNIGYDLWSKVPRLYTVLRIIGQLQLLDSFIDRGITDNWFPFTKASFPEILTPSMRADFEKFQSLVLTNVPKLGNISGRDHEDIGSVPVLRGQIWKM